MKRLEDEEKKEVRRRLERIEASKMQNMIRGAFRIQPSQSHFCF